MIEYDKVVSSSDERRWQQRLDNFGTQQPQAHLQLSRN